MAARILNLLVLFLEVRGLSISISGRKWGILVYYTQLSNLLTALSSLLLVGLGQPEWVTVLRYISTCMLIMTFLVTTCVLIPMGGDPHKLLWSGNGLYHHILCPVLSSLSYLFAENHAGSGAILLPVAITLIYGFTMLYLNAIDRVDGPYPFFQVRRHPRKTIILWMVVLTGAIGIISILVWLAGRS